MQQVPALRIDGITLSQSVSVQSVFFTLCNCPDKILCTLFKGIIFFSIKWDLLKGKPSLVGLLHSKTHNRDFVCYVLTLIIWKFNDVCGFKIPPRFSIVTDHFFMQSDIGSVYVMICGIFSLDSFVVPYRSTLPSLSDQSYPSFSVYFS